MSIPIGTEKPAKSAQKQASKKVESKRLLLAYQNGVYHYKLIKRNGDVALFEQLTGGGKSVAYEVILIQSNQKREYSPLNEDWGKLGWSFSQFKNIIKAFKELADGRG